MRQVSKMYLQTLELLKRKIRAEKIKLVSMDEFVRFTGVKGIYLKDNFDDEVEFSKKIKYVQLHPQEFCKAVQTAFRLEFDSIHHRMRKENLQ